MNRAASRLWGLAARAGRGLGRAFLALAGLDLPFNRRAWLIALVLAGLVASGTLYHFWYLPRRGETLMRGFFEAQAQTETQGLRGLAFDSLDGSGEPLDLGVSRSWDFGDLHAFPLVAHQNFCIRWLGVLNAPASGKYRLGGMVDDGLMILVDGREVVSALGISAPHEVQGKVRLDAGPHALEIRFQQYAGGAVLKLWWQPPGADRQPLDPALLTPLAPDVPLARITRLRLAYGLIPRPGSTYNPLDGGRFWRLPWE